jgi:hypothetical protein
MPDQDTPALPPGTLDLMGKGKAGGSPIGDVADRAVAVLVAFTAVRWRSKIVGSAAAPQVRTLLALCEHPGEQLESVLGATPHEFESRILRTG